MERWKTAAPLVLGLLGAAAGGGCVADGPDCADGEHAVGEACVPDVFDQAEMPNTDGALVDVDGNGRLYVRETLLVGLRDPATTREQAAALVAARSGELTGWIPFVGLYRVRFAGAATTADLDARAAALAGDPAVAFAVREPVIEDAGLDVPPRKRDTDLESIAPAASAVDLDTNQTAVVGESGVWAYQRIALSAAWDEIYRVNPETTPVVVALVDGHVDGTTFGSVPLERTDFRVMASYEDDADTVRHGTGVASVIGAPNDGSGMNGVLSGLGCVDYQLAPMTVLASWKVHGVARKALTGSAFFMSVIQAVRVGARVVNISLGSEYDLIGEEVGRAMTAVAAAIFARAPHVLFVIGAGNNDGDTADMFPAGAALTTPNAMAIAASDRDDAPWQIGLGRGTNHDIGSPGATTLAAPGVDVLTTLPDGRLWLAQATSFATPQVSGVAGLLFAIDPRLSGADARLMLVSTADVIADKTISGRRLNAAAAVRRALDGIPEKQRGPGTCRPPELKPAERCEVGASCLFCMSQSKFTLAGLPPPMQSGTFGGTGALRITWSDENHLSFLSLGVAGLGAVSTAEIALQTGAHTSQFGDGTLIDISGIRYWAWDVSGELKLSFRGNTVSGSLMLVGENGSSASAMFTGSFYSSDGTALFCP